MYYVSCFVVDISVFCSFFFFKQKTAYEVRISDWSSDVCSSDLSGASHASAPHSGAPHHKNLRTLRAQADHGYASSAAGRGELAPRSPREAHRAVRSEEHTSELQSLMRISYAVFCLKKKKKKRTVNSLRLTSYQQMRPDISHQQ